MAISTELHQAFIASEEAYRALCDYYDQTAQFYSRRAAFYETTHQRGSREQSDWYIAYHNVITHVRGCHGSNADVLSPLALWQYIYSDMQHGAQEHWRGERERDKMVAKVYEQAQEDVNHILSMLRDILDIEEA